MRTRFALLVLAIATSASARAERWSWDFGALSYGPGRWSLLRLSNPSQASQNFLIQVFDQDGVAIPVPGIVRLAPGEMREIRIEAPSTKTRDCWAQVVAPDMRVEAGVEVHAFTEFLTKNILNRYERRPENPSAHSFWMIPANGAEYREFYFLNVDEAPTVLSVCWVARASRRDCSKPEGNVRRLFVGPHHSVAFLAGKAKGRFFSLSSSVPKFSLMLQMIPGEMQQRRFDTQSSIQFDEIAK